MGVRERKMLGAVPHSLIAAWAEVITHPGLAARFDSPIGFAVRQMRQGQAPPPHTELDRWAERMRRTTDRYEAWRYIEHPTEGAIRSPVQQEFARIKQHVMNYFNAHSNFSMVSFDRIRENINPKFTQA